MTHNELEELLIRADTENTNGHYEEAKELANTILETLTTASRFHFKEDSSVFFKKSFSDNKETLEETASLSVRTLLALAFAERMMGNYESSLATLEKALSIAEEFDNDENIARALRNIGIVHQFNSDYRAALEYHHRSLAIFSKLGIKKSIGLSHGILGVSYYHLSDYSHALEYFHKSLEIFEELGIKEFISENLYNIGNVHLNLSDFERALEFFQKALEIYEFLGKKNSIVIALESIGVTYKELSDNTQALEYLGKAMVLNKELGNTYGIGSNLGNIGNVHLNLLDYHSALEHFLRALAIFEQLGRKNSIAISLGNIGTLYANQDFNGYDAIEAEGHLLKAISLCEELKDKLNLYAIEKALADLYHINERWKDSDTHFRKYHALEKEVQSEGAKKQAHKLDYERKEAEREKHLEVERARSQATDEILSNILPVNIMERLIKGEKKIVDSYKNVSVLFADIVGFTKLSALLPADELIDVLDIVFTHFDTICKKHGLEKIKTIGDAYMAVCGAPVPQVDHAMRTANAALEMLEDFEIEQRFSAPVNLTFRIGLHSGNVVAGIIGENKYSYDLWGDAVNTASRMESHGEEGRIHVSEDFVNALSHGEKYLIKVSERGETEIKGKGRMKTYYLSRVQ